MCVSKRNLKYNIISRTTTKTAKSKSKSESKMPQTIYVVGINKEWWITFYKNK